MSLKALFRAFAGDCHGGAAPMLAIAALPLFGFVGAAVDFTAPPPPAPPCRPRSMRAR
jgi:Flp pilus assembly protein TadG